VRKKCNSGVSLSLYILHLWHFIVIFVVEQQYTTPAPHDVAPNWILFGFDWMSIELYVSLSVSLSVCLPFCLSLSVVSCRVVTILLYLDYEFYIESKYVFSKNFLLYSFYVCGEMESRRVGVRREHPNILLLFIKKLPCHAS